MKTSELTGAALDWAVAKCEGVRINPLTREGQRFLRLHSYSTNWAQGGPIIKREKIAGYFSQDASVWVADCEEYRSTGQTPLIAAMRCYVVNKLGDEVEIPEELK